MKRIISLALALLLVFSLGVSSFAAPVVKKVQTVEKTDIEKQIDFIFENLADLSQDSADGRWSYTVTDLDHNGNLELIAAICKAPEYYTYAKIFEVSPERDAFIECDMSVEEGKPFIDILQDSADTYYDKTNDTWFYLFSEDFTQSKSEHYAVKCSVSLKDGYVTPASYATEHCEVINGITAVTYEDMDGNLITPDEFNNAGASAFKGFEKSGTNFSWFSLKDAEKVSVLSDSYKVFTGDKDVTNSNKAASSSKGKKSGSFLMITKNPTTEYCIVGDTIYFVTSADNATSYTWSFISPAGDKYTAKQFQSYFNSSSLSGINSPTLTIRNVAENMNGWGAYCECTGNGQTSRSSTAYVYVSAKPTGVISGYVSDYFMSSVTIALSNGTSVQVLKDICNVSGGSLDYGCSCTCYYSGNTPTSSSIYRVDIIGRQQDPDNSTSGTYVASGTDGYAVAIYVPLAGTTLYVSPSIVNYIGNVYDGCPCTVNFRGYVPTGSPNSNIYSVTVYGDSGLIPEENFTWTCDLCYTRNTDNDYYCRSCGNPRYHTGLITDYTWTCDICYTQNTDNDYNCRSCGNPRYHTGLITDPEPVIAPAPYYEETGWNCSSCGTHNGEYDVYCSVCGASRSGTGFIGDVLAPEAYTDVFTPES